MGELSADEDGTLAAIGTSVARASSAVVKYFESHQLKSTGYRNTGGTKQTAQSRGPEWEVTAENKCSVQIVVTR